MAHVAVENSAFEEIAEGVPTGWKFVGGANMRALRGPGLNGSGAVVWEANEITPRQCGCVRDVPFETGRVYRISCAVRAEGFTARSAGAAVCLEWRGRDGRHIGGGYVNHFRLRDSDWVRLEGVTPPVPAEAAAVSVQVYVVKGLKGKVVFDDVRVDPLVLPAVSYVTSSAYRDTATGGCVRVVAEVNIPHGASPADVETSFRWRDAQGTERCCPARAYDDHGVFMDLDIASLASGETPITCALRRKGEEVEVGSATMRFLRSRENPVRRVTLDASGRCIVAGRPFFPIGLYAGDMTEELLEIYCRGPFNAIMPYRAPTPDELDFYAQHGIMVAYSLKDVKLSATWIREKGIATQEALARYMRARIDAVKGHPALLAWYVNDEAPATEIPERTFLQMLYREQDKDHPTWAVMDRTYDLRGFLPTADILGFDPYPVPQKPVAAVSEFVREAQRRLMDARPMWNVPQGFDWRWYRADDAAARMPTEAEVRNMCWQHIASGANGLFLYSFHALLRDEAKADFARNFAMLCRVAGEVRDRVPVLTAAAGKVAVAGDAVIGRAWRAADGFHILLVNTAPTESTCEVNAEDRHETVRLAPLEVRWLPPCAPVVKGTRRLSLAEYRDRMRGAWLGKSIGVSYGWPTEFKAKGTLIRDEDMPVWTPSCINETYAQDDLYVQLGFLRTLAERGLDVSARAAGLDFANTRYRVWCGNFNGRNNIRHGIAAPYSSHPAFHPTTDDLDYQIESDFTGIIAPGMPQVAVKLGNVFGRLMNYADGVYAGQFIGALYAESFFETNRATLIESALQYIPSASEYAEMVRGVLADWRADPQNWKRAWKHAVDAWFNERRAGRVSFPAVGCKVNGAMVLIGFLYGGGDFERTMRIATQCGFDSDCNPSTACGLLGTLQGARAIPDRYVTGLSESNTWEYTDYTFPQLLATCETLAHKMVVAQGGHIVRNEQGEEMMYLPAQVACPNILQRADAPEAVGEVRLTPAERERIRYAPDAKQGAQSAPKEEAPRVRIEVGGELRARIERNFTGSRRPSIVRKTCS